MLWLVRASKTKPEEVEQDDDEDDHGETNDQLPLSFVDRRLAGTAMLSPTATRCYAPVPFCGRKFTRILCNYWQSSMSVESPGQVRTNHRTPSRVLGVRVAAIRVTTRGESKFA
jgi:hypothetical protein